MTSRTRFDRLRPLVGFLATLTLFLSVGAFLLVAQQRAALVEETDKHLTHELGLFESIITEDFLRFDYDAVQQHAVEFGGRFRDIVRIRVAGLDGAAFALYERREPSTVVSGHHHTFAYAAGKSVMVSLDYDLAPIREKLRALIVRVALSSVLFSAVVGSLLWHLLRRIAFSPLERAVADLNLANEHLEQRVTERTRDLLTSNAMLRESEAKFKSFAEQAIVGIYLIQDGFVRYCNPRLAEIFGYATGDLIGNVPLPDLVLPEDLPLVEEQIRKRTLGEVEVSHYQFRGRRKNGTTVHLEVFGSVMPYQGRASVIGTILDITDRTATETAIKKMLVWVQEEKNKSDAIIAAIGDGISIQDRDFRVLYQNEKHKSLLGSHVGEYCHQGIHGRQLPCEGCPVALAFKDGGIHTCERSGISQHGPVDVEITASALRDAAGNITAGIEVVRDITGRVREKQELRDSYEVQRIINTILRMPLGERSIEEILKDALSIVLASSRYASHPRGGIFLFDEGCGDLEMLAQQGLHPAVRESCARVPLGACLCGRAARSREVQFCSTVDERHERGVGRMPAHGHYCVPIVMPDAGVLGVLVIYLESGRAHDPMEESFLVAAMNSLAWIIHRKRLETEQKWMIKDLLALLDTVSAARQEWLETFDSITDMISILDASHTVLRANRAFARHCGREPQEIWGWTLNELDPHGRDPVLADLVAYAPQEGRSAGREVSDPATGKIFHIFTFPLSSEGGSSSRVIHIIREITEEREREMRLIMSERLASLGQMAAGIAHEINNPLAAIAGCVDGLTRRIDRGQFEPELFTKYLAIIRDEVVRSKGITTSMLSLVRKNSFENTLVDVHQAIQSALEIIGYQGRLKSVSVTKSFAAGTPVVLGSEGELKQVLLIVLTNALDAMEEKGSLFVATAVAGGTLTIDITDSGPGIPAGLVVRVFDPFFTTKGSQGGTGLGLSIAKRIISIHHGDIQALPAPGMGTTFRITLPLGIVHPDDEAQHHAPLA